VGSNPIQGMDVCVRLFCLCVVLCVGSGLAKVLIASPRNPADCVEIKKIKNVAMVHKGCKAIDR
jgi:hypothetical protein